MTFSQALRTDAFTDYRSPVRPLPLCVDAKMRLLEARTEFNRFHIFTVIIELNRTGSQAPQGYYSLKAVSCKVWSQGSIEKS